MFRRFEKVLNPTERPADNEPPASLVAFYWHFAKQAKSLFAALFVTGFIVAVLDSSIPAFMGRIVKLVTSSTPSTLWAEHWQIRLRDQQLPRDWVPSDDGANSHKTYYGILSVHHVSWGF